MPFEDLKIRIRMLLEEMTHQPEDLHELRESLRVELAELRSQGLPEPEDLAELEKALVKDLDIPKQAD